MEFQKVNTKKEFLQFYTAGRLPYKHNPHYLLTEEEMIKLVLENSRAFREHCEIHPYLVKDGKKITGRFCFIKDRKNPAFVQLAFPEFLSPQAELVGQIKNLGAEVFPRCRHLLAGIGGHINYSAGLLLNNFDKPPLFGLSYTHPSYPALFEGWKEHRMYTFRFPTAPFFRYLGGLKERLKKSGMTVRPLDKSRLAGDVALYTKLNNLCFAKHPLWTDRTPEEDYELFHPFRFFIRRENLLFLEKQGRTIGFFLWYPDFNALVKPGCSLGAGHLLRYKLTNPIKTFRFTQIGILPEEQIGLGSLSLLAAAAPYVEKGGYTHGEGGFIFDSNKNSMNMAMRYLKRATGKKFTPYRAYGIFETVLPGGDQ